MPKKRPPNSSRFDLISKLDSHHTHKIKLGVLVVLVVSLGLLAWSCGRSISRQIAQLSPQNQPETPLEKNILSLVGDSPIRSMVPYIAQRNKKVAAFLVSIAKQESDWGNHAPVLNGQNCYNYWGYRGQSSSMTWDGYTCFKNPRQAVAVVSGRLSDLINNSDLDTPQKMIVWKCGSTCSGQDPQNVSAWISNVGFYYHKIYD